MASRDLDLVICGATGFTGRYVLDALNESPELPGLRVALAGRRREALAARAARLTKATVPVECIVVDASDEAGLAALAARTTAVLTTVGPYLRHGLPLARACAHQGTHYIDLTGEPPFIKKSIDTLHATAMATGARIVHCGGFDSVPSDLGTLLLQETAIADGGPCDDVVFTLMKARGGFSGGTAHSLLGVIDAAAKDPDARAAMREPYAFVPTGAHGADRGDRFDVRVDDDVGGVVGPFLMAPINTRVVRRSNHLLADRYGRGFRYREQMRFGRGLQGRLAAHAVRLALVGVVGIGATSPGRALLAKVFPAQGTGPSEESVRTGMFEAHLHGRRRSDGAHFKATVRAERDPGYGGTAIMIVEGALRLAKDQDLGAPGVTTPAAALGLPLVERLRRRGFTFSAARM
jgi:short subunit dehydrogenase-like uncharacterized protein